MDENILKHNTCINYILFEYQIPSFSQIILNIKILIISQLKTKLSSVFNQEEHTKQLHLSVCHYCQ